MLAFLPLPFRQPKVCRCFGWIFVVMDIKRPHPEHNHSYSNSNEQKRSLCKSRVFILLLSLTLASINAIYRQWHWGHAFVDFNSCAHVILFNVTWLKTRASLSMDTWIVSQSPCVLWIPLNVSGGVQHDVECAVSFKWLDKIPQVPTFCIWGRLSTSHVVACV